MPEFYLNISVKKYNGRDQKLLTYRAERDINLVIGCVVEVPFRNTTSLGVVYGIAKARPANVATIKPITRILPLRPLPRYMLQLADWLANYYMGTPTQIWVSMLPTGLQTAVGTSRKAASVIEPQHISAPRLNADQQKAIDTILGTLAVSKKPQNKQFLLHGVTGSGKTEVYVRLAQEVLSRGRSVLILVPEISLTPQTVAYFEARLKREVILTHSKLTSAARRKIWRRILDSQDPQIVIGPRSALFLPFTDLGLVVIDEAHEASYKQDGGLRYNALHTAAKLAQLTGAIYVLGSATPGLAEYWLAEQGRLQLLELPHRAGRGKAPQVEIIRLEKTDGLLSPQLHTAITQTLAQRKQVLLFLNRRGSANAQICTNCGYIARCARCDIVMSFHGHLGKLICHSCGWQTVPPAICPECDHTDELMFVGAGTQKIETIVAEQFPEARVARLDGDTATLEHIFDTYARMYAGEIDILIGTQMIARGLDLEHVALVGVILADTMLTMPDYTATERAFALMTQVVGRTGRRDDQGRALIQTYLPHNPIIAAAAHEDYRTFYTGELASRKLYDYPPFVYLLKATIYRKTSATGLAKARQTAAGIRRRYPATIVLGPAQPTHYRGPRGYGWQIIIKAKTRLLLLEIGRQELAEWTIDLDPITII